MFSKQIGRVSVSVNREGMLTHEYAHGSTVACIAGWNDSCPTVEHTMSVDEMRDLRYLLDRAIAEADEYKSNWNRRNART